MAEVLMVIGSLNRETPYFESARGVGLSVFSFDKRDGRASLFCEDGSIDNPTFLALHPGNGCLYAASEVFGWHEGTVSAYRFDHGARRLAYINKQPTLGSIAAHVSLDPSGRYLFVANYGDGPVDAGPDCAITLLPLRPDGGLAPAAASAAHKGRGPRSGRQDRSHAHCALPSPDGRFVIVVDLGLDALMTYAVGHRGTLSAAPVARASLAPGSGPRHAVFHPNGRLVLVISELDSTVTSLCYAPETGTLSPVATVSTLPPGAARDNHCSDSRIHHGGRFAYGANRGHDSIAILGLDPGSGGLTRLDNATCGGRTPRNLAIDPSGRFLLVANQDSHEVVVMAIDPDRGNLARTVGDITVRSPMCIAFAPT